MGVTLMTPFVLMVALSAPVPNIDLETICRSVPQSIEEDGLKVKEWIDNYRQNNT